MTVKWDEGIVEIEYDSARGFHTRMSAASSVATD